MEREGRIIINGMVNREERRRGGDGGGEDSCDETPEHVPHLIAASHATAEPLPKRGGQ